MNVSKTRIYRLVIRRVAAILLIVSVVGLFPVLTYVYRLRQSSANLLLQQNVDDVCEDMEDTMQENLTRTASQLSTQFLLDDEKGWNHDYLDKFAELNFFSEITIVDRSGIVLGSSEENLIGYDMGSQKETAEFLCLLEDETLYFSVDVPMQKITGSRMIYAGAPLEDGGFLLIGMDEECSRDYVMENLGYIVVNRRIGEHGSLIICDKDGTIMGSYKNQYNGDESELLIHAGAGMEYQEFRDTSYMILAEEMGSYLVVGMYPEKDFISSAFSTGRIVLILFCIFFLVLVVTLSLQMRKLVVNGIIKLNHTLSEIAAGNLEEKADVRTSLEFSSLSDDINSTVEAMKGFIAREAARIDQDLAVAKEIQLSNLPSRYPPFPDRHDFSLYASMDPAKEVGGDFYDYYFLGDNTLAFLVADVSGKGIPGAMYMMSGKSVIRGFAESGYAPADIIYHANCKLNENNEAGMFITVWMGFLDTESGLVRFVNAGHNPPVLIREGKADFIQQKANMVLGIFDGVPYKEQYLQLQPGDMLFLYTDGVPEAINAREEEYGEDRLLAVLSEPKEDSEDICRDICQKARKDVAAFVGNADQFDDITMVCLHYVGEQGGVQSAVERLTSEQ